VLRKIEAWHQGGRSASSSEMSRFV
jgi:hypothetical protein